MKLDALVAALKGSGKASIRIDRASQDLVHEAVLRGCKIWSWEDAQIIGRFYHYELKVDGVEVMLITQNGVTKEEVERAEYLGMTVDEMRRTFGGKCPT